MAAAEPAPKKDGLMQDMIDERLAFIEPLEERIGIPRGTMGPLLREENDWAFIIKLAVICEASLMEVLVSHLHNESLRLHVQRLQLQGRTGRIQLALQTGLIDEEDAGTFGAIADVRNQFAHSPRNIGGSLEEYAKALPLHDKQQLMKRLFGLDDQVAKDSLKKDDWLPSAMRFVLWLAGGQVLARLALRDAEAAKDREERKLLELQAKAFDALQANPGLFTLADLFKNPAGTPGLLGV